MRMANQQLNPDLDLAVKVRECAHLAAHKGLRSMYWQLLALTESLGQNDKELIAEYDKLSAPS